MARIGAEQPRQFSSHRLSCLHRTILVSSHHPRVHPLSIIARPLDLAPSFFSLISFPDPLHDFPSRSRHLSYAHVFSKSEFISRASAHTTSHRTKHTLPHSSHFRTPIWQSHTRMSHIFLFGARIFYQSYWVMGPVDASE